MGDLHQFYYLAQLSCHSKEALHSSRETCTNCAELVAAVMVRKGACATPHRLSTSLRGVSPSWVRV